MLPGDYPDPSVIRVGNEYWATATTSQWAPIFPLLHSTDLVHWRLVGNIFHTPPSWSAGSYWAPEIAEDRGAAPVIQGTGLGGARQAARSPPGSGAI